MDALDMLSDDEDGDVVEAEEKNEEPDSKRLKLADIDVSKLLSGLGSSAQDDEADAAASFKKSCSALEQELKSNDSAISASEQVAPAPVEGSTELGCERPPDTVNVYDPSADDFEYDFPDPCKTWEEASEILHPELLEPLISFGFPSPTAIQAHTWPIIASGRDLIGVAKTGSGKTLAFLLPCFSKILDDVPQHASAKEDGLDKEFQKIEDTYSPDILVLAPSRELVSQIVAEANKFQATTSIKAVECYGGTNRTLQLSAIRKRPQCIAATPGRLNDYLGSEASWMNVDKLRFLILDEADRMLDDGFEPQIRGITGSASSSTRQGMLFSATFQDHVSVLASWVLRRPVEVRVGTGDALKANINIDQQVEFCKGPGDKEGCLKNIFRKHFSKGLEKGNKGKGTGDVGKGSKVGKVQGKGKGKDNRKRSNKKEGPDLTRGAGKVIVFCAHADTCTALSKSIYSACRLPSETLHSGRHQSERDQALSAFRFGDPPILFATSVAGRGIDVKHVGLVVNYDAPDGAEDYVHRIGRTARAGKKGTAITLLSTVTDSEAMFYIEEVMLRTGVHVPSALAEQLNMRRGRSTRIERMTRNVTA